MKNRYVCHSGESRNPVIMQVMDSSLRWNDSNYKLFTQPLKLMGIHIYLMKNQYFQQTFPCFFIHNIINY
jgi:hypothetical protein